MGKWIRSFSIFAIVSAVLAWVLSGCAPEHHCHECPPYTHAHSYGSPDHSHVYGASRAAPPC